MTVDDFATAQLPSFAMLGEPELAFASGDLSATHPHPLAGLQKFGAFDKASFQSYVPHLRVALVGPRMGRQPIGQLLAGLKSQHRPTERNSYVKPFPGFEALFGVGLRSAEKEVHVTWPDAFSELGQGDTSVQKVRSALHQAMSRLSAVRDRFDVAAVHLPDAWMAHLRTKEFDAHDELKALGAHFGIPTQVINDRAITFGLKSSLSWRLSIALYAKAGGTPWKLARVAGVPEDTAYIGLAYAIRRASEEAHFVTCCSQVFDIEGGGMQFVAFQANDAIADEYEARRNPFLSRADMRAVLTRSLRLYQEGHAGRMPRRLVIHKTTSFKDEELAGVRDATVSIPEVECLEVSAKSAWRGVWMVRSDKGSPSPVKADGFPVPRGALQMHSSSSALLWVAGNAPTAAGGMDYFQGGKSIPKPVLIRRHAGSGPFDLLASEALALTKMDWNNDALYDPVPVTITYSQRLARTISNVPTLPGNTYPYRLFM
jgi:hypothetical protein